MASLLVICTQAIACEMPISKTVGLNKSTWKLTAYKCPHGCSSALKNILETQLGQSIDFQGTTPWKSGTSDACQQPVNIQTRTVDSNAQIKEINASLPPEKAISSTHLDIQSSSILITEVFCLGTEKQQISHRFIQNKPEKLILLDEEESILIYE